MVYEADMSDDTTEAGRKKNPWTIENRLPMRSDSINTCDMMLGTNLKKKWE